MAEHPRLWFEFTNKEWRWLNDPPDGARRAADRGLAADRSSFREWLAAGDRERGPWLTPIEESLRRISPQSANRRDSQVDPRASAGQWITARGSWAGSADPHRWRALAAVDDELSARIEQVATARHSCWLAGEAGKRVATLTAELRELFVEKRRQKTRTLPQEVEDTFADDDTPLLQETRTLPQEVEDTFADDVLAEFAEQEPDELNEPPPIIEALPAGWQVYDPERTRAREHRYSKDDDGTGGFTGHRQAPALSRTYALGLLGFTADEYAAATTPGRPSADKRRLRARLDARLAELHAERHNFAALATALDTRRASLVDGAKRGTVRTP